MKQFAAVALLVSSVAVANQNVTVTGSGSNPEEARQDALHQASMRYCPSAVVNDREYQNENRTRSNLTVYNGCIVKNYTILNEQIRSGVYSITVNAEVIPNQLGSRIINQHPEWFYFDLNQHNDRMAQLALRQENAISLIDEIFYDFPQNAFTLNYTPYKITYEGTTSYFNTSFKITWNNNFINAVEETLDLIQDKPGKTWGNNGYLVKVNKKHMFDNFTLTNQIRNHLANQRPVIRIQILDSHDNSYVNVCYQLRSWFNLYNTLGKDLVFFPQGSDMDPIKIKLPRSMPWDAKVLLDVVPNSYSFCKEFY